MRYILFLLFLLLSIGVQSRKIIHPRIYITDSGKQQLTGTLQSVEWKKRSYELLKEKVDPYVNRHRTDSLWIISRMQMYWDSHYERVYVKGHLYSHGTGRAPVPTVKFAGNRDVATDYLMPSIEDTQPYMDEKGMYLQNRKKEGQPWEWVHPSKTGRMISVMNDRIMGLAADAAFLYWYTGEEKYAVFASDIFLAYVTGMYYRREPFALEDYTNSHLMGLATFEVILDAVIPPMALSYDFLYPYLKKKGADFDMIAQVFKRFAEQEIMYGVPDNNWNIFQARFVTYLALALEDDDFYKDGRGRQYYLNEILNHTTIRQFALKEMIDENFDPETGMWMECASYSMSVCKDMLDVICLIDNAENNRILDDFPILKKAVPATAEYLFPNGRITAFGDAKYTPLQPRSFELLIALYRKYGTNDQEKSLTRVLQKMISDGFYDRSADKSLFSICFHVDTLTKIESGEATYDHLIRDTYHAPNVSWLIQRNGRSQEEGMAFTLTGAFGNHAHANGISLEMYGKGLMLAPESSFGESYGTRDNQEYFARFPAHNTVIVDGKSDYAMMRSYAPYTLLSCYPAHGENIQPFEKVTFARVELTEPKTGALQERLTGIVRTGEKSAYVVDIFRSARKDGKDVKHEYLYHSIGQGMDIMNMSGQKQTLQATRELSSEAGDMNGYNYFTNKKAIAIEKDFRVRFDIRLKQQDDVFVNLWMKGYSGRTVFVADAPPSNAFGKGSIPDELLGKPLPTLIVRQKGEAWSRPFVAVYNPYRASEGASVKSVEYFDGTDGLIGITVRSNDRTDCIFNSAREKAVSYRDMRFKGIYAVVSEKNGRVDYLFLGDGQELKKDKWQITAKNASVNVSLCQTDEGVEVTASGEILLQLPVSDNRRPAVANMERPDEKIQGTMNPDAIFSVPLQAGKYRIN